MSVEDHGMEWNGLDDGISRRARIWANHAAGASPTAAHRIHQKCLECRPQPNLSLEGWGFFFARLSSWSLKTRARPYEKIGVPLPSNFLKNTFFGFFEIMGIMQKVTSWSLPSRACS